MRKFYWIVAEPIKRCPGSALRLPARLHTFRWRGGMAACAAPIQPYFKQLP